MSTEIITEENMFPLFITILMIAIGIIIFMPQIQGMFETSMEKFKYEDTVVMVDEGIMLSIPTGETNENVILNHIIPNLNNLPNNYISLWSNVFAPISFGTQLPCYWTDADKTCINDIKLTSILATKPQFCTPINKTISNGCLVEINAGTEEVYKVGVQTFISGLTEIPVYVVIKGCGVPVCLYT